MDLTCQSKDRFSHLIKKQDPIICCLQETYFTIKVAGYKINTQRSVTFLSTNSEQSEKEIGKPIPFTKASENYNA
jgi:hypothetical protein